MSNLHKRLIVDLYAARDEARQLKQAWTSACNLNDWLKIHDVRTNYIRASGRAGAALRAVLREGQRLHYERAKLGEAWKDVNRKLRKADASEMS